MKEKDRIWIYKKIQKTGWVKQIMNLRTNRITDGGYTLELLIERLNIGGKPVYDSKELEAASELVRKIQEQMTLDFFEPRYVDECLRLSQELHLALLRFTSDESFMLDIERHLRQIDLERQQLFHDFLYTAMPNIKDEKQFKEQLVINGRRIHERYAPLMFQHYENYRYLARTFGELIAICKRKYDVDKDEKEKFSNLYPIAPNIWLAIEEACMYSLANRIIDNLAKPITGFEEEKIASLGLTKSAAADLLKRYQKILQKDPAYEEDAKGKGYNSYDSWTPATILAFRIAQDKNPDAFYNEHCTDFSIKEKEKKFLKQKYQSVIENDVLRLMQIYLQYNKNPKENDKLKRLLDGCSTTATWMYRVLTKP